MKGSRCYAWAWIDLAAGSDDRWLLVRRQPHTGEHAYYLCWADRPQPLTTLTGVAGQRWAIEETLQAATSQVGLDHDQVRHWTSWHRYLTLARVALAFLAVAASQAAPGPQTSKLAPPPDPPAQPGQSGGHLRRSPSPSCATCSPACCYGPRSTPPTCSPGHAGDANTTPTPATATTNADPQPRDHVSAAGVLGRVSPIFDVASLTMRSWFAVAC